MARRFIDPKEEAPALRRAAVLLERLRQDDPTRDPELDVLQARIQRMQHAAAVGLVVDDSAIDRMQAALSRIISASERVSGSSGQELLRHNVLVETRELLLRLTQRS